MTKYYVRIIDEDGAIGEAVVEDRFIEDAANKALMQIDIPELRCWEEDNTLVAAVSESEEFTLENTRFVKITTILRPEYEADELYLEYDEEFTEDAHKLLEVR